MPHDQLPPDGSGDGIKRDANGRYLVLPPHARPWKAGQSGNPTGKTGQYAEIIRLARSKTLPALKRMVELAELDNVDQNGELSPLSRRADARVVAHAVEWLWSVAWGKPNGSPAQQPLDESPGITIEQRRDEAMATLQAAFERVLQASKAQAAREAAGETEPAVGPVVTIDQVDK